MSLESLYSLDLKSIMVALVIIYFIEFYLLFLYIYPNILKPSGWATSDDQQNWFWTS